MFVPLNVSIIPIELPLSTICALVQKIIHRFNIDVSVSVSLMPFSSKQISKEKTMYSYYFIYFRNFVSGHLGAGC